MMRKEERMMNVPLSSFSRLAYFLCSVGDCRMFPVCNIVNTNSHAKSFQKKNHREANIDVDIIRVQRK